MSASFKNRFLSDFKVIRPRFEVPQQHLIDWLVHASSYVRSLRENGDATELQNKMQKFVSRFACDPSRIASRGIHLSDAYETNYDDMSVYKISPERLSGVGSLERNAVFSRDVREIFTQFFPETAAAPEHIVHVTCTGYVSPSGPQELVSSRGWSQTQITHAYHMGCYASVPSIRMASAFVDSGLEHVDVVHTEMCSLHLNPADFAPEQIVVESLFADGFIHYKVSGRPAGFEILDIKEYIIPGTSQMMTWLPGDVGMKMTLSKDVPGHVASHVAPFLQNFSFHKDECVFAIHPGGPRIIDTVADHLHLSDSQVRHSREVLKNYGNMSSATLPHIWKSILDDPTIHSGQHILSLAFGPGLTIFGMHLKKV